jgi:hypothetical protein
VRLRRRGTTTRNWHTKTAISHNTGMITHCGCRISGVSYFYIFLILIIPNEFVLRQSPPTFRPCVRGTRGGIIEWEESCLLPAITGVDTR